MDSGHLWIIPEIVLVLSGSVLIRFKIGGFNIRPLIAFYRIKTYITEI
jgi:hypothetical protein